MTFVAIGTLRVNFKIGLPYTRTKACDQRCGLLIAFPNEKYSLKQ